MSMVIKKVSLKTNRGIQEWIKSNPCVQVVDPGVTGGPTHVKHSVNEVLKAFEQNRNIARTKQMELLIRLTGERQINKAIEQASVKADQAVFISWAGESAWEEFKGKFVRAEEEYSDLPKEKLLDKIEKSATFWMRS